MPFAVESAVNAFVRGAILRKAIVDLHRFDMEVP